MNELFHSLVSTYLGKIIASSIIFSFFHFLLIYFVKRFFQLKWIGSALLVALNVLLGVVLSWIWLKIAGLPIGYEPLVQIFLATLICVVLLVEFIWGFALVIRKLNLKFPEAFARAYSLKIKDVRNIFLYTLPGLLLVAIVIFLLTDPILEFKIVDVITLVLVTPVIEEFVFRFSIPFMLKIDIISLPVSLGLSLLFALMHESNSILLVFIYSLYFYYTLKKTNKIHSSVIMHSLINLSFILLG